MELPASAVYISPLTIQSLWTGLQKGEPVLHLASDGSFSVSLPHLDISTPDVEVEFVSEGTYKQAIAYDMGRLHTEQKNAIEISEAQNKYNHFQNLVKERIHEVRMTPSPTIPIVTQNKIDKIIKGLDVINFKPQLATFGEFCSKERELLDRCYLGNPQNTIACHDYAVCFQQCVYQPQNEQQNQ